MKYKVKEMKSKLEEIEKKIVENMKNNKSIILMFTIILVLFLFQNMVVSMYFDDFGNASLSYAYITPGVPGTDYSFSQMLEWSGQIYNNWGGRILYANILIPLLKHSISSYMLVQSFVLTFIIYAMYKITNKILNLKSNIIVPIVLFSLYLIIDMHYLRHGIYWASASILYIWPLLPFFAIIYTYLKVVDKIKNNEKINYFITLPIIVILSFLTTFSQEQMGIALIAFLVIYIIIHHIKEIKRFLIIDLTAIIITIISYLALFMAPGNWVRMSGSSEFSNYSFIDKIFNNFSPIIWNIFAHKMNYFIYFLSGCFFIMIVTLIVREYKKNKKYIMLGIIPIILATICIMYLNVGKVVYLNVFGILWFVSALIITYLYFKDRNEISTIIALEFSAVASAFCLLLSPSIPERTFLPLIFIFIVLVATFIKDFLSSNSLLIRLVVIVVIGITLKYGIANYIEVYRGYSENYAIEKLNFEILRNYEEGQSVITLYRVKNFWYGSITPYEEESIFFWIRQYFYIPSEVEFEWIDIYENIRI